MRKLRFPTRELNRQFPRRRIMQCSNEIKLQWYFLFLLRPRYTPTMKQKYRTGIKTKRSNKLTIERESEGITSTFMAG